MALMSNDMNATPNEFIMKDGTLIKLRKTPKILRYVRYSKIHDPENYYREQLMLFLPWRDEKKDLLGKCFDI